MLSLPQYDSDDGRAAALMEVREAYQFEERPLAGPPGIRETPDEEDLTFRQKYKMLGDLSGTLVELGLAGLENLIHPGAMGTMRQFEALYPGREQPRVVQRWHRDDEFGAQRLVGTNPLLLRRCNGRDELPKDFAVPDEVVAEIAAAPLDVLARESRLYSLDFEIFEGITPKPGCYLAAPLCLFFVDRQRRLMPLAVQLEPRDPVGPVFTPLDAPTLWLLVKMWVQSADAMYQEVVSHLLPTHLACETVWIAARRALSPRHPLHELLSPHYRSTIAINHHARRELLAPGGPLHECFGTGLDGALELMRRGHAKWRYFAGDPLSDFAARGVGDPETLPGFYYRDDTLKVWRATQKFISGVLDQFYHSDADVAGDTEVQAWIAEMVAVGLLGFPLDARGRLATRTALLEVLTRAIFTASAEHASINNGQFQYFGYIPDASGVMRRPPPRSKDLRLTEADLVETLPDLVTCCVQISIVHMLSTPPSHRLGEYPDSFFASVPGVRPHLDLLRSSLAAISSQIRRRNLVVEAPYPFLDPRLVGQSVEI